MNNIIIHISGSSGSGKTTLGIKLKKIFKNKIILIEVDDLHMNIKTRAKYWNRLSKTKTITEAKKMWKELMDLTITNILKKYNNKIIIFVGLIQQSLGSKYKLNFYNIKDVKYKFYLDVPINIILERYYKRLYTWINKSSKKENNIYWNNVGLNYQYILGSNEIILNNNRNIKHAKKYKYEFLTGDKIINKLKNII